MLNFLLKSVAPGRVKRNRGMSYVELIVVLSIFSIMTSIVIFNYGEFQAKVDIKNLASDIALKIVEAQNAALSGNLSNLSFGTNKPSYGVYFNITNNPKQFIYFADLNNAGGYGIGELIDTTDITKGNYISGISKSIGAGRFTPITDPLSITFKRPDSSAVFTSNGVPLTGFDYIQITIASPKSSTATIKVYPSGRIQVN